MRILEFNIDETLLSKNKNCDFNHIIKNSINFLQCVFNFDSSWKGFVKVAVFNAGYKDYPVLLNNDLCMIPNEVTKYSSFKLYIVGQNQKGVKIQTKQIKIEQEV